MSSRSPAGTTYTQPAPINTQPSLRNDQPTSSKRPALASSSSYNAAPLQAPKTKGRSTITSRKDHDSALPHKLHRSITFAEYSPQLSERDSFFADHYVSSQLNSPPAALEKGDIDPAADSASTTHSPSTMSTALTQTATAVPSSAQQRQVVPSATIKQLKSSLSRSEISKVLSEPRSHSGVIEAEESTQHKIRRVNSDGHTRSEDTNVDLWMALTGQQNDQAKRPVEPETNTMLGDKDHNVAVEGRERPKAMERALRTVSRIERSVSRGRTHVDKSIEATVKYPEVSGNVRSRKASHIMGIFDPKSDLKVRENRPELPQLDLDTLPTSRMSPPYTIHGPSSGVDYFQLSQSPVEEDITKSSHIPPPSSTPLSPQEPDTYFKRYDIKAKSPIPASLLQEIRNVEPLSSARPSVPRRKASTPGPEVFGGAVAVVKAEKERRASESEGVEEEHISAAVYYPHTGPAAAENEMFEHLRDSIGKAEPRREEASINEPSAKESVDLGNREDRAEYIDISVESEHEKSIFHGSYRPHQEEEDEDEDITMTPRLLPADDKNEIQPSTASESELDSSDGTDASQSEDGATTPTQKSPYRQRAPSGTLAPNPKGAVVLEPYSHQVGGHSTLFRFSRRAICKQLNNRENEFYERIEQRHPDMLKFLPRYIGVLNVTFSKGPKQQSSEKENTTSGDASGAQNSVSHTRSNSYSGIDRPKDMPKSLTPQPRIVSHSQRLDTIPQVILNQNKHIVPSDYFGLPERPKSADPQHIRSRSSEFTSESGDLASPTVAHARGTSLLRPAQPVHSPSWGTTTVNEVLRDKVLREVFGPPPIKFKRHHHAHSTLPKIRDAGYRKRSNLSSQSFDREDSRGEENHRPPLSNHQSDSSALRPLPAEHTRLSIGEMQEEKMSTSASAYEEIKHDLSRIKSAVSSSSNHNTVDEGRPNVRRRHSGMGLRRRRTSVNGDEHPLLEYFEDEALMNNKQDEVFRMDEEQEKAKEGTENGDSSIKKAATFAGSEGIGNHGQHIDNLADLDHSSTQDETTKINSGKDLGKSGENVPKDIEEIARQQELEESLPVNPKDAQNSEQRVAYFILLEDLTSGMGRPCVLDLKMGTRQYGVEATKKKMESQRRKCKTTSSYQLGVRICGMQTWNAKTKEFKYEDKYFGRDLSAGRQFRDALTRFLYDGVSYSSVARHIPSILHKIGKLESMVRRLPGYRFYASSLLMFYDADPEKSRDYQEAVKNGVDIVKKKHDEGKKWPPPIELKLVDFANCVTAEDELPEGATAPPAHPHEIDRGYLRGLKTLKAYFTQILKEIKNGEYVERGEAEDMTHGDDKVGTSPTLHGNGNGSVVEGDDDEDGQVSF